MPEVICCNIITEDGKVTGTGDVRSLIEPYRDKGPDENVVPIGSYQYSYYTGKGIVIGRRPIGPQRAPRGRKKL